MTLARRVLLAAMVVAARFVLGPFRFIWPVTTPMNEESFLFLWNSRVLYLASAGLCLFLALAADRASGIARPVVFALILAFHVAALEHNLGSWRYAGAQARRLRVMGFAQGGP